MLQQCVCRDIEHAGSLESKKVARVELLRLLRALQTSRVLNILLIVLSAAALKHGIRNPETETETETESRKRKRNAEYGIYERRF